MPDEFKFKLSAATSNTADLVMCERLEAILAELRALRLALSQPMPVRLSADDIHSLTHRP